MTQFLSSLNISKKWLITGALIFVLSVFTLVYSFNQFYRQDRISVEVLQGNVIKSSNNQKNTMAARGNLILPGDTIEISKAGAAVLIFHDGSTLSFKAGETIKYEDFGIKDKKNYFSFAKPASNNEKFEYITESYLNKAGAVILGKEDANMESSATHTRVLGASDKKMDDVDKIKLWDNLNKCIQSGKNDLIYNKLVEKCMADNNLYTIESLNY